VTVPARPHGMQSDAGERFDWWCAELAARGIDQFTAADLVVVQLLATTEATLALIGAALVKAGDDVDAIGKLTASQSRATRDMRAALTQCAAVFGDRLSDELPAAPAPTSTPAGRVVPFRGRHHSAALPARILVALDGDVRLTKGELRARVRAKETQFLRALRELVDAGDVVTGGRGHRGSPRLYARRGGSDVRQA
jgi:hypothetical protein